MKVKALLGGLGVLLSLIAAAITTDSSAAPNVRGTGTASAATTISVVMNDRSIAVSPKTISAGPVTFVVRNAGKAVTRFVLIRTNRAPKSLATAGTRASEVGKKATIVGIAPRATKKVAAVLTPGKYVVIGNMPGQYKRGQFAGFTATAGASGGPQTTQISVSAYEMGFKLSQTKVPWGTVIFTIKNDGKLPHDFSFGSRGGGSDLLDPGETTKLTVEFPKPGITKFTFICTVEGHYAAGMYGVLTVT